MGNTFPSQMLEPKTLHVTLISINYEFSQILMTQLCDVIL